ncbi:MAG: protein kinase domain-containing protein [Candidatus Nanoarchaeia archaeon]
MRSVNTIINSNQDERVTVSPINSSRYKINTEVKILGRGSWGAVYSGIDTETGIKLAIKVLDPTKVALIQMKYRDLTYEEAIKKEIPGMFGRGTNLVQRWLEFDDNGKPFIIMSQYDKNLEEYLQEDVSIKRTVYREGKSPKEIYNVGTFSRVAKQMAKGVSDFHVEYCKAHADIKFANYLVLLPDKRQVQLDEMLNSVETRDFLSTSDDRVQIHLNDYGSSSQDKTSSTKPRDNIGDKYSRAPETFRVGFDPNAEADYYQLTNCLYKMITGEFFLEQQLKHTDNPENFMRDLEEESHDAIKNKKVNDLPNEFKHFEKFFKKGLNYNPQERFKSDTEMLKMLEDATNESNIYGQMKSYFRKTWRVLLLGSALAGSLIYLAKQAPESLVIPDVNMNSEGNIALVADAKVNFERDTVFELASPNKYIKLLSDNDLAFCTTKGYVGYMLRYYDVAVQELGMNELTNNQTDLVYAFTNADERNMHAQRGHYGYVSRAIEIGLGRAKKKSSDGKINVDLEDVCAIARLGETKVIDAMKVANSFDYKVYSSKLPPKEVKFINYWLSLLDDKSMQGLK